MLLLEKVDKQALPKQGLKRSACVFTFQTQALHHRCLSSSLIATGSRYASLTSHIVVVDLSSLPLIAIEAENHMLVCQTLHFCLLDYMLSRKATRAFPKWCY
jgi:hypothetical protein